MTDDPTLADATGDCPSRAQLISFASGGTAVGVELSEHVAACARCSAIVAAGSLDMTRGSGSQLPVMLERGAMVGRYRISERIGQGGMGVVYRAKDTELDRQVALKLVNAPTSAQLDELTERLRRESRLQARASHPAVITVYDIGRDGDRVYVAMELALGGTLRAWTSKPHGWREIVGVFRRAGEGLAAAHAAGLVHRDFKPDNVLVEERDGRVSRVLVTDFGVARAVEATEQASSMPPNNLEMTATGALVGTPAYMAPEQFAAADVDARTDVFAFGVGLWEALYGERPYTGASIAQLVLAMDGSPKPPANRRGPRWLERVLRRALAIEPARRYQSMPELLHALDWRRRGRRVVAGVAGALAIATVIAVGGATRDGAAPPSPCELDPQAGVRIAGAARHLKAAGVPDASLAHRAHWVAALETYARAVPVLRQRTCAAPPGNWEDRVRCLDSLATEIAVYSEGLARLEPATRGRLLRGRPVSPPHECLSELTSMPPKLPGFEVLSAKLTLALNVAAPDPAAMTRVEEVARRHDVKRLVHELALVRAELAGSIESVREVAVAAERDRQFAIAARAWRQLAIRVIDSDAGRARDLLAQTDVALTRAGNPPRERALWHALAANLAASEGDMVALGKAIAACEAVLAAGEVPFDLEVMSMLGKAQLRAGNFEQAHAIHRRNYERVMALDPDDPESVSVRNSYAASLMAVQRPDEAARTLEAMVTGASSSRLTRDVAVSVTLLASSYTQQGQHTATLRLVDHWRAAIDRVFPRSTHAGGLRVHHATSALALQRHELAERSSAQALEMYIELYGSTHYDTADVRVLHGQALLELGRLAAGREEIEHGLADLTAASNAADPLVLQASVVLADAFVREGNAKRALAYIEPAFEAFSKLVAEPVELARTQVTMAKALAAQPKDLPRARALVSSAIAAWSAKPGAWKRELADARAFAKRLRRMR